MIKQPVIVLFNLFTEIICLKRFTINLPHWFFTSHSVTDLFVELMTSGYLTHISSHTAFLLWDGYTPSCYSKSDTLAHTTVWWIAMKKFACVYFGDLQGEQREASRFIQTRQCWYLGGKCVLDIALKIDVKELSVCDAWWLCCRFGDFINKSKLRANAHQ